MTNLEKMKDYICKQIMEMTAEEFYEFISQTELREYEFDFFNTDELLNCQKCRAIYGRECCEHDDAHPYCVERFVDYSNQISE